MTFGGENVAPILNGVVLALINLEEFEAADIWCAPATDNLLIIDELLVALLAG